MVARDPRSFAQRARESLPLWANVALVTIGGSLLVRSAGERTLQILVWFFLVPMFSLVGVIVGNGSLRRSESGVTNSVSLWAALLVGLPNAVLFCLALALSTRLGAAALVLSVPFAINVNGAVLLLRAARAR